MLLEERKQVFVHIKAFANRQRRPEVDQVVTYSLSADERGRPCAVNATLTGDRIPERVTRKENPLSLIGSVVFLAVVAVAALTARVPPLIFALYILASLLTFIMYVADKSTAKKGTWRIEENTLHMLSLAGGWPGALLAQKSLRHKTKKQSFRSVFLVTVLLNAAAFLWLLTPTGSATLQWFLSG